MLIKIAWKNIVAKPLSSFLCVLLMMFGIAIISLVMQIGNQLEAKFSKNISGIDMVVGAKGSPLQLILSSVFQIDAPTGNISLQEASAMSKNPMIKTFIPLSMGDSYMGYRIVGTNARYAKHFDAQLAEGRDFQSPWEVVLGAEVAAKTGLKVGDTFASSHGLDGEGETHDHSLFRVVGIWKPNQSVLDNVVVTSLQSVWMVHAHGGEMVTEDITAALIQFRSPMGLMTIPRNINANSRMQAALPAIEINRLFALLGVGISTLTYLAWAIMIISGISVFISLYNALKERKFELALLLSMGATRTKLFLTLLFEGLILVGAGAFLGLLISRIGLLVLTQTVESNLRMTLEAQTLLPQEWYLVGGALVLGILASILPSFGVYRLNISNTLAEE